MNENELLISWLNDAYGMENSLIETLEEHEKAAAQYPKIQAKIQEHLNLTKGHAEKIQALIGQLNGDVSALKKIGAIVMGNIQGIAGRVFDDAIVKNSIAEFAAENFEIASYSAIIALAESFGENNVADVCQGILADEQEMADWLDTNLPDLVLEFSEKVR